MLQKIMALGAAALVALSLSIASAPAQGKKTRFDETINVSGLTVQIPEGCPGAGTNLTLQGDVRIRIDVHTTGSGKRHIKVRAQTADVTATGGSPSETFKVKGKLNLKVKLEDDEARAKVHANVQLKGDTSNAKFKLHVHATVTLDADGKPVIKLDKTTLNCDEKHG